LTPAKNLTIMDYFYRHSLLAMVLVLAALALCGGVALDRSKSIKRERKLNASLQEAQHEQEAQLQEITALNEALQEKQAHLEEVSCEQEAQLEEITALNGDLQEKQAHLEEVSCEQEAQLEEINSLNGALQDQQRKLEEAKGAAEAANQAKTNFLFSMSHDIRTPMNAIIGYTELLEKYKEDQVRREDYIAKIKSANEFLLSLINNVLEMARIESGKVVLSDEAVCVLDFNKEIESVYGELMGGTIKVESTLGKGTTFVFTVLHRKATKVDAQEARGTAVQENGFAGKRLLLAEDNELNAEIALELLGELAKVRQG